MANIQTSHDLSYIDKSMNKDIGSMNKDIGFMNEKVEFVVEDVYTESILSKDAELSFLKKEDITKKFTSKAEATLFRWDFGDGTPSLETRDNPIYHTYEEEGIYSVSHQACKPDWCCSGWCVKPIEVRAPPVKPKELGIGGFITLGLIFGFIKQAIEKCKEYKTEEKCKKHKCLWKNDRCTEKENEEFS